MPAENFGLNLDHGPDEVRHPGVDRMVLRCHRVLLGELIDGLLTMQRTGLIEGFDETRSVLEVLREDLDLAVELFSPEAKARIEQEISSAQALRDLLFGAPPENN